MIEWLNGWGVNERAIVRQRCRHSRSGHTGGRPVLFSLSRSLTRSPAQRDTRSAKSRCQPASSYNTIATLLQHYRKWILATWLSDPMPRSACRSARTHASTPGAKTQHRIIKHRTISWQQEVNCVCACERGRELSASLAVGERCSVTEDNNRIVPTPTYSKIHNGSREKIRILTAH